MSVGSYLDTLRAEVPACRLAAFGDIHTAMILRVSAERNWTQERLDALCRKAVDLLDGPVAISAIEAFDMNSPAEQAIAMSAKDMRVFVRAGKGDADMVCCVCDLGADAGIVSRAAKAALAEIARGA